MLAPLMRALSPGAASCDYPDPSDVRAETIYADGTLTGTLIAAELTPVYDTIPQSIEQTLREGISRLLRNAKISIGGREMGVLVDDTIDNVKSTQLPLCVVGVGKPIRETSITHETSEFEVEIPITLIAGRAGTNTKAHDQISEMKRHIIWVLRNSTALGADPQYGIFKNTCELVPGDGEYESPIGVAKEFDISIVGHIQST